MTLHARDTLPSSWASRSRPTLCLMTVGVYSLWGSLLEHLAPVVLVHNQG